MPLVSVIMPCFNHARYVEESIKSVLRQTERNLELIVVDDGSKDASSVIIHRMSEEDTRIIPIFHASNLGASVSRNDGLKTARSEYIAFCDADDIWLPRKLEKQLALLADSPEAAIAYGETKIIDSEGRETGQLFSCRFPVPGSGSGDLFNVLCVRNFINMTTALIRGSALAENDGFDPEIRWVEDWLFWIKLAQHVSFVYSPEPLSLYRVHEASSATTQVQGVIKNRIKVYLEVLRIAEFLPRRVRSEVLYRLGVALAGLEGSKEEKKHLADYSAKKAYALAFRQYPLHWKAAVRLLLAYAHA